jgi:hypothetical protein
VYIGVATGIEREFDCICAIGWHRRSLLSLFGQAAEIGVGLPWVRKEDYAAFFHIEDTHGLPTTWEKLIEFSEEAENGFQSDGMIVERVYIDPETFPDWGRRNGVGVNSQGRMRFAGMAVAEKYGRNQR